MAGQISKYSNNQGILFEMKEVVEEGKNTNTDCQICNKSLTVCSNKDNTGKIFLLSNTGKSTLDLYTRDSMKEIPLTKDNRVRVLVPTEKVTAGFDCVTMTIGISKANNNVRLINKP